MQTKTKIASSIIAAAMACCLPFIISHEGEELEAYPDTGGVWTICHGVTIGVKPGDTKTKEECDELTRQTLQEFMDKVAAEIKIEPSPKMLAAHASFAYNIGIGGYRRSMTLRETNKGNVEKGCNAMMNWYTAGGRDCRIRSNNCYGVIVRRKAEVQMCLEGV